MSLSSFTMSGFIGSCFFSLVGYAAFRYGKQTSKPMPLIMGIVLMLFPYFVADPVLMWVVGAGLTGSLYFLR